MTKTTHIPLTYCLHLTLAGWSADDWSDKFEGVTARLGCDGTTVLTGDLKDQAAFFGLLRSVESRGLKVIACIAYPGGAA